LGRFLPRPLGRFSVPDPWGGFFPDPWDGFLSQGSGAGRTDQHSQNHFRQFSIFGNKEI
jgi:hypothetical protein